MLNNLHSRQTKGKLLSYLPAVKIESTAETKCLANRCPGLRNCHANKKPEAPSEERDETICAVGLRTAVPDGAEHTQPLFK